MRIRTSYMSLFLLRTIVSIQKPLRVNIRMLSCSGILLYPQVKSCPSNAKAYPPLLEHLQHIATTLAPRHQAGARLSTHSTTSTQLGWKGRGRERRVDPPPCTSSPMSPS
uniref:Uncharacterized protein n=1 Tax=Oryza brachyantha TaxID=4533 RepID=J3N073_ORYBR